MKFSFVFLAMHLVWTCAHARIERVEKDYGKGSGQLRSLILSLVDEGYYFSAIPLMKEYFVTQRKALDQKLDQALETIIDHAGVKPFETMPENILNSSRSANVLYILARRKILSHELEEGLRIISKVSPESSIAPYALHLKAAALSLMGKNDEAKIEFNKCISYSQRALSVTKDTTKKNQMKYNLDTCKAGLARTTYAEKKFNQSDLLYLDIEKDSMIWPEILFEEAWNSYYQKNYNRTLGKLVTYKAPIFDFIFKPEIDVLRAVTYLKMCLYEDAKQEVDQFYKNYLNPANQLRSFLLSKGKNYSFFYDLASQFESSRGMDNFLMNHLMLSLVKDGAYQEMKQGLLDAIIEYKKIKSEKRSNLRSRLLADLKEVVEMYRKLIGSYTRNHLVKSYAEIFRAFKSMSFIKLEVLAQKKEQLYRNLPTDRSRGDIKYIERNDKQYFWDFNGEFWADELGDYVFALGSEC